MFTFLKIFDIPQGKYHACGERHDKSAEMEQPESKIGIPVSWRWKYACYHEI
jgi:hypothetical protein